LYWVSFICGSLLIRQGEKVRINAIATATTADAAASSENVAMRANSHLTFSARGQQVRTGLSYCKGLMVGGWWWKLPSAE